MLRLAVLVVLACVPGINAHSQEGDPGGTVTLVAAPRLVDPDYRGAVLLAVPVDNNRHVGVIINRPTGRSLASLFPEHAPPSWCAIRCTSAGRCCARRFSRWSTSITRPAPDRSRS